MRKLSILVLLALFCVLIPFVEVRPTQAASATLLWGATLYGKPPDAFQFQSGGLYYNFEKNIAKHGLAIIAWGAPWEYPAGKMLPFQKTYFENVRLHGSIPLLHWGSWSCCGAVQSKYKLTNITRGDFDTYLKQWATDAKNWGYPLFLRFDHEMNGYWQFPWSVQINGNAPVDYIAAWRHVHNIFVQVGATNVTWVWSPNISSTRTTPMAQVYPGDGYVDWIALDGYNWYTRNAMPWFQFTQVFQGDTSVVKDSKNSYQEITTVAPSKPLMIAEFASIEYGDGGAKKAAWLKQALLDIPVKFPKIKAIVYFNWNDNNSSLTWPIESSSAAQNQFAISISVPLFAQNTFTTVPRLNKVKPLS